MDRKKLLIVAVAVLNGLLAVGCQPKTPAEKVQNKVEDAAHETGQAIERVGEKAKDAVN